MFLLKLKAFRTVFITKKEQGSEALPKLVKECLHCTTSGKYPVADI